MKLNVDTVEVYQADYIKRGPVPHYEKFVREKDFLAALAERDKEIKRVKTKLELVYCILDEMKSQYEFCDCSDDPDDDICIGCRLTEILSDMRAEVPSET